MLYPEVGVYWLTASAARKASQSWISRVRAQLTARQMAVPSNLTSYQHFLRFGDAMLDKIASWRGELHFGRDVVFAPGAEEALNVSDPRGKLLLASHLGDVEACRALAQLQGSKTINSIVISKTDKRFRQIKE